MFQDYNIAVLLSVYKNDKADFLQLSVDSILNQSYKNITLYIGVDGSIGEKLYKCLEQYEQQKRVNIVYFPEKVPQQGAGTVSGHFEIDQSAGRRKSGFPDYRRRGNFRTGSE